MSSTGRQYVQASIAALFLLTGCAGAAPKTLPDAATQVKDAEDKLTAALAISDVEEIETLWANDFVSVMTDGQIVDRERRIAAMRAAKPAPNLESRNENVSVRIYGDIAVAFVKSVWIANGQPVGQPYQATHVWVRRGGAWKLAAAHISEVTPKP